MEQNKPLPLFYRKDMGVRLDLAKADLTKNWSDKGAALHWKLVDHFAVHGFHETDVYVNLDLDSYEHEETGFPDTWVKPFLAQAFDENDKPVGPPAAIGLAFKVEAKGLD